MSRLLAVLAIVLAIGVVLAIEIVAVGALFGGTTVQPPQIDPAPGVAAPRPAVSLRPVEVSEPDGARPAPAPSPSATAADEILTSWKIVLEPPLDMGWSRVGGATTWTGSRMLTFGGHGIGFGCDQTGPYEDGASFDPATGQWQPIASSPLERRDDPAWAWTGGRLVVWGGQSTVGCHSAPDSSATGAAYDPSADTWSDIDPGPLGPRLRMASAWTGQQLLIWGGIDYPDAPIGGPPRDPDNPLDLSTVTTTVWEDGAGFDPASGDWEALPDAPDGLAGEASGAWSGTRFVVATVAAAAAYDPEAGTWRNLEPLPSDRVPVLAGADGDVVAVTRRGGVLSWHRLAAGTTTWEALADPPSAIDPDARDEVVTGFETSPTLSAAGDRILVSGLVADIGLDDSDPPCSDVICDDIGVDRREPSRTGSAILDPVTGEWTALPVAPFGYRSTPIAIWTGRELILWGGADSERRVNHEDAYRPAALDPSRRGAMIALDLDLAPTTTP